MTAPEAYGAFAFVYDEPLGKAFFSTLVPLISQVLERYPTLEKTHLDLACGTGLAMEYFQELGFLSTGVDASIPMLGVARNRASRIVAGDLRDLPLRGQFARITSFYDSLNHLLQHRELVRAFRCVRRVMHRNSLFLFDMNQPEIYRTIWGTPEPFEVEGNDYFLRIRTTFSSWTNTATGLVDGWMRLRGHRYNIREVRRQRAYSRRKILSALSGASLEPLEILDFDPFPSERAAEKAKWLFVVRPV